MKKGVITSKEKRRSSRPQMPDFPPKIKRRAKRKKLVSCQFILLSRESDQCAIRARLGVASHLSTTPRWGNPAKCLSQRHNRYTCRLVLHTVPLMLSVKQGSCEYQFSSHWFDPTRNQTQVYSSRDGRSIPTRPSEL